MVDLIKTNWGVANYYSNPERIEINEKLDEPQFEGLRQKIIKHEFEHHRAKGFVAQRKVDVLTELKFRDLFPFYRKYPKTFLQQHSPITYKDNIIYFEWTLIFLYLFYIGLSALVLWRIKLFSKDSVFFWKVLQYMFWIFAILVVLYLIGKILRGYINEEFKKEVTKK